MAKSQRRGARSMVAAIAVLVAGLVHPHVVAAAPAGVPHYPDLVSNIPLAEFGIVQTSATTREFRYTHIISNLGDGPLELRPTYDATTDTATAVQRIYTHNASGAWSTAMDLPVVGRMIYHPPHGHYHFPLAEFGLYAINGDGSRGAPVTVSPKVGFCIGDSVPTNASLPHFGAFGYSGAACSDPRATMGISVGMGDLYDFHDDGQTIDASAVADGEYWFHSVVDPWNYLRESNESNNITDVRVRISGGTVTVVAVANPASTPPAVSVTAPTAGAAVSATTTITASADPSAVGVQLLLDGNPLGAPDTSAPYSLDWDTTTVANGTHLLAAQAIDALGRRNTTAPVQVQVANSPPAGVFGIDALTSVDGRGQVQTPSFSCTLPGETLLALVASDGPPSGQQSTVTGAGLTWSLVQRANTQAGTSEIWSAVAPSTVTNAQVTATPRFAGYDQTLTVVSLVGASGLGAKAGSNATTGAPKVNLTTTVAGSMVFAVGNDWDRATPRTLLAGQTMLHQWVDNDVGDTFWAQRTDPLALGTVSVGGSAPTNDRWNLAAVEVTPTNGSPPPPPPPAGVQIHGVLAANRTATSVQIQWTTDVASDSLVDFGTSTTYDRTASSGALVTSHAIDLTGLSPATTYHYRLRSVAADGRVGQSGDFIFTTASVSTITCSITAPAPAATVSGTVQVTVNASSTASVSGVQLRLDGAALGVEDTALPYAVSWDTTTAALGAHALTAVVRDPTGNTGQCAPVNVTVERLAPPPPATGPVAAWSFNAGSGTTVADTTGRGHTGTLVSGTWTTAGRHGGAITFNGTSTRVNIVDAADLRLTTSATLEAWVRPTSSLGTSWRTVLLREQPGGLAYALYANGSNSRPSAYLNAGGTYDAANGAAQLAVNTWTHLAMTYDGATIRLYVNGVLVRSQAHTGPMASAAGALRIGGNAVWGEYFAGQIDEVRVYDRVLTAGQLATDMITPL